MLVPLRKRDFQMRRESLITIRNAIQNDALALAGLLRGLGWFERMAIEPPETTMAIVACHLEQCLADGSHSIYVAEDQVG
jgi:hypothetical protein